MIKDYIIFCESLLRFLDFTDCSAEYAVRFTCTDTDGKREEHFEVFAGDYESNYIEWFNDWFEGQHDFDLLGIYNIKYLILEKENNNEL